MRINDKLTRIKMIKDCPENALHFVIEALRRNGTLDLRGVTQKEVALTITKAELKTHFVAGWISIVDPS